MVKPNGIVVTLFRLIWTHAAYDFCDDFKIKKDYDRDMKDQDIKFEGVGMDFKSKNSEPLGQ